MATIPASRIAVAAAFLAAASSHVLAADLRPGFACPRPTATDQLASAICADPGMAKAELTFEKAYYTQREFLGQSGWKDLKVRAVGVDTDLRKTCGIPASGHPGPMPPDAAACYEREIGKATTALNQTAWGVAADEAARPIERHVALQQKLVDLGLAKGPADGIYGDGTRQAIVAWQTARGQKATGFLTDLQADELMAQGTPDQGATASATAAQAAAPSAPSAAPPPVTVPASPAAAPAAEAPSSGTASRNGALTLQDVFSRDMANVTVLYLESKLGPAKRVEGTRGSEVRTYALAGCEVTAYAHKGSIYGYGMDVSRACNVNLSELANAPLPPTRNATFGQFEKVMPGTFRATCLQGCGNAADPTIIWSSEGSHAQDFVHVELHVILANKPVLDAADKWEAAMKASGGDDYIESGSGACDGKHDDAAQAAFSDVGFTHLYVGNGPSPEEDGIEQGCKPS